MMLFLLAEEIKKEECRKWNEMKNIAVILGDPRLPDSAKPGGKFDEDDLDTVERLKQALAQLRDYTFSYFDNHNTLESDLQERKVKKEIDFAFNLCDEGFKNDPRREADIPEMLNRLNIQHTGAGAYAMGLCYNKLKTLRKVRELKSDIGIPQTTLLLKGNWNPKKLNKFRLPVIVKPNCGDGSVGITQRSVAYNVEELAQALEEVSNVLHESDLSILVQEYLTGADLTFGVIGNPGNFTSLPITKEDFSRLDFDPKLPRISGYEAKWYENSPYWNIKSVPANLPKETEELQKETNDKIIKDSLFLFEKFKCRDYARFDWRLDDQGTPKLLEVNPNPGWCYDGHLARAAEFAGINYSQMLDKILKSAERRLKLE